MVHLKIDFQIPKFQLFSKNPFQNFELKFESEADYREKLVTLRESYFPSNAGTQRSASENLSEEVTTAEKESLNESISPMMAAYLQTLSRASKK